MISSFSINLPYSLLLLNLFVIISCGDPELQTESNADQNFKLHLTDAPIDDQFIESVYLSFSAVTINGKVHAFENTQTVDISALTQGQTITLFDGLIEDQEITHIGLMLDYGNNSAGNTPGCYVLDKDGRKHNLNSQSLLPEQFELSVAAELIHAKEMIIDLDLRKALFYEEGDFDRFELTQDLSSTMRIISPSHWNIEGRILDSLGLSDDKLVVYAYLPGTFDKEKETHNANAQVPQFAGALTSSEVLDGRFTMNYLPVGTIDLYVVSYKQLGLTSELQAFAIIQPSIAENDLYWTVTSDNSTELALQLGLKTEL